VQSPRQRTKGKGKKGKEGKTGGKETAGENTSPFQTPSVRFRDLACPRFYRFHARNRKCYKPFSGHECGRWTAGNGTSLAKGLPDITKTPDDVKALLEKADKEAGRLGLKNLQQAAKHLDKSKKHLKDDQRKAHRARWLQHVTEGVKMWERQLEEYRRDKDGFRNYAGFRN